MTVSVVELAIDPRFDMATAEEQVASGLESWSPMAAMPPRHFCSAL